MPILKIATFYEGNSVISRLSNSGSGCATHNKKLEDDHEIRKYPLNVQRTQHLLIMLFPKCYRLHNFEIKKEEEKGSTQHNTQRTLYLLITNFPKQCTKDSVFVHHKFPKVLPISKLSKGPRFPDLLRLLPALTCGAGAWWGRHQSGRWRSDWAPGCWCRWGPSLPCTPTGHPSRRCMPCCSQPLQQANRTKQGKFLFFYSPCSKATDQNMVTLFFSPCCKATEQNKVTFFHFIHCPVLGWIYHDAVSEAVIHYLVLC